MRSAHPAAGLLLALVLVTASSQARPMHEPVSDGLLKRASSLGATSDSESDSDSMPASSHVPGTPPDTARQQAELRGPPKATGLEGRTFIRPDRHTRADDALSYEVFFEPSVAPMKRFSVFDSVSRDLRFHLAQSELKQLPIGPEDARRGQRRRFSARLRVRPSGRPVRIPSVAPDMRLIELRSDGPAPLFYRDEAGHYYVHGTGRQAVDVALTVDAASAYFGGIDLPSDIVIGHQAGQPHTRLPRPVRSLAERARLTIGIDPEVDFATGVRRLVQYFRSFSAGQLKPAVNDILNDIIDAKLGVCRHRAFAFMIVARHLGVPTRMVYNEAHAFVEIFVPKSGWLRIDLGGVAPSLTMRNAEGGRLDEPPADPFPKPPPYRQTYSYALVSGSHSETANSPVRLNGLPSTGDQLMKNEDAAKREPPSPGVSPATEPALKTPPTGEAPINKKETHSTKTPDMTDGDLTAPDGSRAPVSDGVEPYEIQLLNPSAAYSFEREARTAVSITGVVLNTRLNAPAVGVYVEAYAINHARQQLVLGGARTDKAGRFVLPLRVSGDSQLGQYILQFKVNEAR